MKQMSKYLFLFSVFIYAHASGAVSIEDIFNKHLDFDNSVGTGLPEDRFQLNEEFLPCKSGNFGYSQLRGVMGPDKSSPPASNQYHFRDVMPIQHVCDPRGLDLFEINGQIDDRHFGITVPEMMELRIKFAIIQETNRNQMQKFMSEFSAFSQSWPIERNQILIQIRENDLEFMKPGTSTARKKVLTDQRAALVQNLNVLQTNGNMLSAFTGIRISNGFSNLTGTWEFANLQKWIFVQQLLEKVMIREEKKLLSEMSLFTSQQSARNASAIPVINLSDQFAESYRKLEEKNQQLKLPQKTGIGIENLACRDWSLACVNQVRQKEAIMANGSQAFTLALSAFLKKTEMLLAKESLVRERIENYYSLAEMRANALIHISISIFNIEGAIIFWNNLLTEVETNKKNGVKPLTIIEKALRELPVVSSLLEVQKERIIVRAAPLREILRTITDPNNQMPVRKYYKKLRELYLYTRLDDVVLPDQTKPTQQNNIPARPGEYSPAYAKPGEGSYSAFFGSIFGFSFIYNKSDDGEYWTISLPADGRRYYFDGPVKADASYPWWGTSCNPCNCEELDAVTCSTIMPVATNLPRVDALPTPTSPLAPVMQEVIASDDPTISDFFLNKPSDMSNQEYALFLEDKKREIFSIADEYRKNAAKTKIALNVTRLSMLEVSQDPELEVGFKKMMNVMLELNQKHYNARALAPLYKYILASLKLETVHIEGLEQQKDGYFKDAATFLEVTRDYAIVSFVLVLFAEADPTGKLCATFLKNLLIGELLAQAEALVKETNQVDEPLHDKTIWEEMGSTDGYLKLGPRGIAFVAALSLIGEGAGAVSPENLTKFKAAIQLVSSGMLAVFTGLGTIQAKDDFRKAILLWKEGHPGRATLSAIAGVLNVAWAAPWAVKSAKGVGQIFKYGKLKSGTTLPTSSVPDSEALPIADTLTTKGARDLLLRAASDVETPYEYRMGDELCGCTDFAHRLALDADIQGIKTGKVWISSIPGPEGQSLKFFDPITGSGGEWKWHVANVVNVRNPMTGEIQMRVLDPTLSPAEPLSLNAWMSNMGVPIVGGRGKGVTLEFTANTQYQFPNFEQPFTERFTQTLDLAESKQITDLMAKSLFGKPVQSLTSAERVTLTKNGLVQTTLAKMNTRFAQGEKALRKLGFNRAQQKRWREAVIDLITQQNKREAPELKIVPSLSFSAEVRSKNIRSVFKNKIGEQNTGMAQNSGKPLPVEFGNQVIDLNHSPKDIAFSESQGRIFRDVPIRSLPRNQFYTFVIKQKGSIAFGQVKNGWEVGSKHLHISEGEVVMAAGEIHINSSGEVTFNLLSGTFTQKIIQKGHSTGQEMKENVTKIFSSEVEKVTFIEAVLLPSGPPTSEELALIQKFKPFMQNNPDLASILVSGAGPGVAPGAIR